MALISEAESGVTAPSEPQDDRGQAVAPAGVEGTVVRVMIVDDHDVLCRGLVALLADQDGLIVCGVAHDATQAIAIAQVCLPDVVLMDVRLGASCGITATREMRARLPKTRVVMFTSYDDEEALFASIMAGASGYLLKQMKGLSLVAAIHSVAAGHSLLDPGVTNLVIDRLRDFGHPRDEKLARLSTQEERVLTLVAQGMTNKQIAAELFLAENTVKNHVSHILSKLEMGRRSQAAALLSRHNPQGPSPRSAPASER